MTKKSKAKAPKAGSGTQREMPFFRPFADVPLPKREPAPNPSPSAAPRRPATARQPAPRKSLQEDDALTFERFMSGVTPLDPGARRIPASSDDPGPGKAAQHQALVAQQQEADQEARARLHALVEEGSRFEVTDDGRRIEGRRFGVDGGQVRRMRLGELPIDATLDLHGMRVDEARAAVEAFVRDRRVKSDHVVTIVHGRGRNSPGGVPVLRGEVAAWLSEGRASTHVAAFATAPDPLGGEGAICVLLAGHRDGPRRV
jgi:DNA-nicking Smr family endonuclease